MPIVSRSVTPLDSPEGFFKGGWTVEALLCHCFYLMKWRVKAANLILSYRVHGRGTVIQVFINRNLRIFI